MGGAALLRFTLRAYALGALLAAAFLSTPAYALASLALLAFYAFLRLPREPRLRWATNAVITDLFVYFALIVLLLPRLGGLAAVAALPLLGGLLFSLESAALHLPVTNTADRQPTRIALTLFAVSALTFLFSMTMGQGVLAASAVVAIIFLTGLFAMAAISLQKQSVDVALPQTMPKLRLVAGERAEHPVALRRRGNMLRKVAFTSPYDWLTVEPVEVDMRSISPGVTLTLAPPLSGPAEITLAGSGLDRFGLLVGSFQLRVLELLVTPRARYAAWVARRYIQGTGRGLLPLLSASSTLHSASKSATGIEYYGSRPYQPGDSLHEIDWKHSAKLNQLVAKEFSELRGRPALMLVNLCVSNPEEADNVAYRIIAAALFFSREKIPAVVAAYDNEALRVVTNSLSPAEIVPGALSLVEQIVIVPLPVKYLAVPDVSRLRSNLFRLGRVDSVAARGLSALLKMEYESLRTGARANPATLALLQGISRAERDANLVVISRQNHDAESLAFNIYTCARRGRSVIVV